MPSTIHTQKYESQNTEPHETLEVTGLVDPLEFDT